MDQAAARRTLEAAARQAAQRGSLLFHLDLATELARAAMDHPAEVLVATVGGQGYEVACVDDSIPPGIVARVRFAPDGRPIVDPQSGAATAAIEAIATAHRSVAAARVGMPGTGRATLVVPPEPGAEIEAYAVAIAERPGDVVLGVHWRLRLSTDGRHILDRVPLSRGRLVMPSRDGVPPSEAELTHFGAVPSEIHVYLCLKHGIELRVVTLDSGLVWSVSGEQARIVGAVDG